MDCSPPGSSLHGILQARILEWVAMPSYRESSWLRDWTCVSGSLSLAPPTKPARRKRATQARRRVNVQQGSRPGSPSLSNAWSIEGASLRRLVLTLLSRCSGLTTASKWNTERLGSQGFIGLRYKLPWRLQKAMWLSFIGCICVCVFYTYICVVLQVIYIYNTYKHVVL